VFEKFTAHPRSRGMTYLEHLRHVNDLTWRCLKITWALIIHGWFPYMFEDYASKELKELAKDV